jgi:hypothetical protein
MPTYGYWTTFKDIYQRVAPFSEKREPFAAPLKKPKAKI